MKSILRKLSPAQSRNLYDLAIFLMAGVGHYIALNTGFTAENPYASLIAPAIGFLGMWFFGIYSWMRVGSGIVKSLLIFANCLSTGIGLAWAQHSLASGVLWTLATVPALALPRLFLNWNKRFAGNDFFGQLVKSRGPVLVIGGGGYIGSYVVEQVLESGHNVRILDRFLYGRDSLAEFANDPRVEILEGDDTDIMKLTQAMDGASAVIHLAGLVGDPACKVDPEFTRHANVIATRMIKDMARSFHVPKFVFASSCSVYGISDNEVNEDSVLNPVSLYAETKIDSEKELLPSSSENFSVTVLRFATVFGHSRRPRFDLVGNLFTAQAYVEGKINLIGPGQWRPFIHVKDLARAVVMVLKADPAKVQGQVYNVGDERLNLTIGDLANAVKKVVESVRPVEIQLSSQTADLRNYAVSFKKIQRDLGFRASVLIEDGILEILQNFKSGTYRNYRDPVYSNLEMTKVALEEFRDPMQNVRLYRPMAELPTAKRA